MNNKYLISHYGAGYAVGLINEEGAQEDINLAHNLYDATCHPSIFHGAILFNSIKQFRRFLAFKCFYKGGVTAQNEFARWRAAFKEAKEILKNDVRANNFMLQMVAANNSKHNVGYYQDETDHEC